MQVYKFGGASVKDAESVKNVKDIIFNHATDQLIVVVSAMGKTTNLLEDILNAHSKSDKKAFKFLYQKLSDFHLEILNELFENKTHVIYSEISDIIEKIFKFGNDTLPENYDYAYDQVVSLGELISSKIIHAYISLYSDDVSWIDVRKLVRTDNYYRSAEVNWDKSTELIQNYIQKNQTSKIFVTQGFVGHTPEGFTTTLGREGSDYTAGIFAYCLNATGVTIWKDVPGMLNADPKLFNDTVKLNKISFKEAIELSYFGASVIHPKTVKPLQNKEIPLYIKSFIEPEKDGTIIQQSTDYDENIPSFIIKQNQILLSITPKDFSFIVEQNMSEIFNKIALVGAKVNVMQNSALSFSICLDLNSGQLEQLLNLLKKDFIVKYNDGLELVTIRHYNQETINRLTQGKQVFLEQRTRQTVRLLLK